MSIHRVDYLFCYVHTHSRVAIDVRRGTFDSGHVKRERKQAERGGIPLSLSLTIHHDGLQPGLYSVHKHQLELLSLGDVTLLLLFLKEGYIDIVYILLTYLLL